MEDKEEDTGVLGEGVTMEEILGAPLPSLPTLYAVGTGDDGNFLVGSSTSHIFNK